MQSLANQELRQPPGAEEQERQIASEVRRIDPALLAECQQIGQARQQNARVANCGSWNRAANFRSIERVVGHIVVILPVVSAALWEHVDMFARQLRRDRQVRRRAEERREVTAVIEMNCEQLPTEPQDHAEKRRRPGVEAMLVSFSAHAKRTGGK